MRGKLSSATRRDFIRGRSRRRREHRRRGGPGEQRPRPLLRAGASRATASNDFSEFSGDRALERGSTREVARGSRRRRADLLGRRLPRQDRRRCATGSTTTSWPTSRCAAAGRGCCSSTTSTPSPSSCTATSRRAARRRRPRCRRSRTRSATRSCTSSGRQRPLEGRPRRRSTTAASTATPPDLGLHRAAPRCAWVSSTSAHGSRRSTARAASPAWGDGAVVRGELRRLRHGTAGLERRVRLGWHLSAGSPRTRSTSSPAVEKYGVGLRSRPLRPRDVGRKYTALKPLPAREHRPRGTSPRKRPGAAARGRRSGSTSSAQRNRLGCPKLGAPNRPPRPPGAERCAVRSACRSSPCSASGSPCSSRPAATTTRIPPRRPPPLPPPPRTSAPSRPSSPTTRPSWSTTPPRSARTPRPTTGSPRTPGSTTGGCSRRTAPRSRPS